MENIYIIHHTLSTEDFQKSPKQGNQKLLDTVCTCHFYFYFIYTVSFVRLQLTNRVSIKYSLKPKSFIIY